MSTPVRPHWLALLLLHAAVAVQRVFGSHPRPESKALPVSAPPALGGGGGTPLRMIEPPFWTYFVPNPVIPPRWPEAGSQRLSPPRDGRS